MSPLENAQLLIKGAENASAAGDIKAALELAIEAGRYLQLARLLDGAKIKLDVMEAKPVE